MQMHDVEARIAQLTREKEEFTAQYFDSETKKWKGEDSQTLRNRYRRLQNEIRFLDEEMSIRNSATPQELKLQLFPLVSRRQTRDATFGKLHSPDSTEPIEISDGDLFCFNPQDYNEVIEEFCGCGVILDGWQPSNPLEEAQAAQHLTECKNKYTKTTLEPIRRFNHTRGNWHCKGCLNTSNTSGPVLPEGLDQLVTIKFIDWCPRFIPSLRYLELVEYLKTVSDAKCYAGLMHSQLEMGDRESKDGTVTQHVKIVRVCDTCAHRIEEDKTFSWTETPVEVPTLPVKVSEDESDTSE